MISSNRNTDPKLKENNGNNKLLALIIKKGKRDVSGFKKAFGQVPDFPSIESVREKAWP